MIDQLVIDARTRLGRAEESFRCCDTDFYVRARGPGAERAVAKARRTAESLEARLNAFADDSAVARLNREGSVTDRHVAALVERGLEYADRTDGVFDVQQGEAERELKAYIRGETDSVTAKFGEGSVTVEGETVEADRPLDLNGLAKGYVVDRAAEEVTGSGRTGRGRGGFGPTGWARTGFVDGGGDIAHPTGPVGVESPYGDSDTSADADADPLTVLDTDWNVATSAGYERRRGGVDHVYNPVIERIGTPHDVVTVVAERDCTEADALATTLAALPVDEAVELVEEWVGAEALVVHQGVFHRTGGFGNHVHDA